MFSMILGSQDMAIDLGTANTLVYLRGKGVVLGEPSVVAIDSRTGELLAVGAEAKHMIGRTPAQITAIRPLRDGVIADFDTTARMIRYFVKKVQPRWFYRPEIVICVPSESSTVERRAAEDAAFKAGARRAYVIEESMAAAIGEDLPVSEAKGSMVVDIGGGTTEIGVLSLGGVVAGRSIRTAGYAMDQSIIEWIHYEKGLRIGTRTAEDLKIAIGSAWPRENRMAEIQGHNLHTGQPDKVVVTTSEIREAIKQPVDEIVDAVKKTLTVVNPDIASDIIGQGILVTGGGALLAGLKELLEKEIKIKVRVSANPLLSVVLGAGKCLEERQLFRNVLSITSSV